MPADIFGDRFYGYREPAWHRIGTVFEEPLSVSEAVEKAGMDYKVALEGLYHSYDETLFFPIQDKRAVVRSATPDDPQKRVFGIVGSNYHVINNIDLGRIIDPLVEKWPLETVGALGYGETVFFTLKAGEVDISGEEIQQYFLLTDSKDGKGSLTVAFVPLRVVCQNTLITGLRSASATVSMRHYQNIEDETKVWIRLMKAAEEAEESVVETLRMMASSHLSHDEISEVIEAAYPTPKPSKRIALYTQFQDSLGGTELQDRAEKEMRAFASQVERILNTRTSVETLMEKFNDEQPSLANTGWAVYNSVVELEDWRDGRESSIETSALFGKRADTKKAAFEKTLQFVR